jgi:hypothetical protein
MNFIAARFLMLHDGNGDDETAPQKENYQEEHAYWLLVAVCTKICPGYYVPSMTGTLADIRVIQDLLHARMPAVASKIRRLGVPLEGIISNWLLTLYCSGGKNGIPFHISVRILDVLMLEGKMIFVVGVGVFVCCVCCVCCVCVFCSPLFSLFSLGSPQLSPPPRQDATPSWLSPMPYLNWPKPNFFRPLPCINS